MANKPEWLRVKAVGFIHNQNDLFFIPVGIEEIPVKRVKILGLRLSVDPYPQVLQDVFNKVVRRQFGIEEEGSLGIVSIELTQEVMD